jgi:hypothetical protein
MQIEDVYNLIAAELLKLNSNLLQRSLEKSHKSMDWVKQAKQTCIKEIRANPIENKTRLKASCAFIWSWIRLQNISTREVYILLIKWLLETEASVFTKEFDDLCLEFGKVLEEGYNGETDFPESEIQGEWFFIVENYYPVFKEMVNDLLEEEGYGR